MSQTRLTDVFVRKLKAGTKRQNVMVVRTNGRGTLGVRITPKGVKTFVVRYKRQGRSCWLTLGRYPEMSVADANAAFAKAGLLIAQGLDPKVDHHFVDARSRKGLQFRELAALYMEKHAKPKKRSWREDQRQFNHDLLPVWGSRVAAGIKRREVRELIERIDGRAPAQARKTLGLLKKLFSWAIEQELLEVSPADRVRAPTPPKVRDRRLSETELRIVLERLSSARMSETLQLAFRLILMTAQRPGEVCGARWREFNLEEGWWTIPAERTKNGVRHRVPITDTAAKIIERARELSASDEWLFSIAADKPILVTSLTHGISRSLEHFGVEKFTSHDLRRTAATHMTRLKVPRLVVQKILNHKEQGVTARYDQHTYDDEKTEALTKWSDFQNLVINSVV